jgi:hypothetical protein
MLRAWSALRGWGFARKALVAALALHAGLATLYAAQSPEPAFDFDRYYEIASAPGRPYVDHPAEQPLLAVAAFRALAHLPGGRTGFGLGLVALNVAADALIVGALLWGWGERAAAVFAVMVIPLLDLFFNRIDAWSVAAAVAALAASRRGAPRLAGVALALGAGLKLWPLVLAGALVARSAREPAAAARVRAGAFIMAAGALAACSLLVAGWAGLRQVLTFRGAQGWQIEGVVGSVLHLAGAAPLFAGGSWRIGAGGPGSIAMFALAAPLSLWSGWRGARTERLGAGWLAAVTVLLLMSALLSAQYLVWLVPGAAIAWTEGARLEAWLTALAVVLTCVFWSQFPAVLGGRAPALVLVVARNAVLVALAVMALARLAKPAAPVAT